MFLDHHFSNKFVLFWCDDKKAMVHIIHSQTPKYFIVLRLICHSVLRYLHCNICIMAKHVSGLSNEMADAVSHFQSHRLSLDPVGYSMSQSGAFGFVEAWRL